MTEKCQMLKENAKDKNPMPTKIPNVKKSNLKQCQQKMHQLLPKKWKKVESPPQKNRRGNKLKKRNIYFDHPQKKENWNK